MRGTHPFTLFTRTEPASRPDQQGEEDSPSIDRGRSWGRKAAILGASVAAVLLIRRLRSRQRTDRRENRAGTATNPTSSSSESTQTDGNGSAIRRKLGGAIVFIVTAAAMRALRKRVMKESQSQ